MSMKRLSSVLGFAAGLAAAIAACNGKSPTAPNPLPPPSDQPVTYSLGGRVTEPVNVPVEGASVTIMDGPYKGKSSITDGGGGYLLSGIEGTSTVQITKSDYTPTIQQIRVTQATLVDFEITPVSPHTDVNGAWTVTFEPNSTCPHLTKPDSRKYRASIVQQGAQLAVTLSGAGFMTPPEPGTIHGSNMSLVLPGGSCAFYCYYGPIDPPAVVEAIAATARPTSIAGTLSGEFTLTKNATPPFDVLGTCANEQHRVTFTR
jgi:hypothetical protein